MPKQVAGKYKAKMLMLINFFYATIPHMKSLMNRFISCFFFYLWLEILLFDDESRLAPS